MESAAGERREIEYAVHGGVSLKGHLYAPKGPGKFPLVIAVHGGGWRLANLDNYRILGPWLAERGYAVLAVTHRCPNPRRRPIPRRCRTCAPRCSSRRERLRSSDRSRAYRAHGRFSGGHLAALVALAGEHALFREGNAADPHGRVSTAVKACVPSTRSSISRASGATTRSRGRATRSSRSFSARASSTTGASTSTLRPLSHVSAKKQRHGIPPRLGHRGRRRGSQGQSGAFLEALKQAGTTCARSVLAGAPHFWIGDPIDEPGSHSGFFAQRLLRFLQARL